LFFSHAAASASSLELLWEAGLCCFGSSRRSARVLHAMATHGDYLREPRALTPSPRSIADPPDIPARALCEYEAKALLAAAGLSFPRERLARSEDETLDAAREL